MLVQNDRDVSLKGHCVSGTIRLGDQGSQNIRTGSHRFGTSRHPTVILLIVGETFRIIQPIGSSFLQNKITGECNKFNNQPRTVKVVLVQLKHIDFTKKVFKTVEYLLSNNIICWFVWIFLSLAIIPQCLTYWLGFLCVLPMM